MTCNGTSISCAKIKKMDKPGNTFEKRHISASVGCVEEEINVLFYSPSVSEQKNRDMISLCELLFNVNPRNLHYPYSI